MEVVVVDTDVVSYLFKLAPHSAPYERMMLRVDPVVSFMTLAELRLWGFRRQWGRSRRESLELFLSRFSSFHSTPELCHRWAQVTDTALKSGRPIACADAWIAATALELDCPLITHNARDYAMVSGLEIRSAAAAE